MSSHPDPGDSESNDESPFDPQYVITKVDADGSLILDSPTVYTDERKAKAIEKSGLARETMALIPSDFVGPDVRRVVERNIDAYHDETATEFVMVSRAAAELAHGLLQTEVARQENPTYDPEAPRESYSAAEREMAAALGDADLEELRSGEQE